MPSSSTGYPERMITKAQPTSSGQYQTFSSGCKLNMKVDSEIEMESGSTFNLESGAHLTIRSGGRFLDQNVTTSTGHTGVAAITNYGVTLCRATGVRTLDPVKGARKTLIFYGSTKAAYVRGSTRAKVKFGTSNTVLVITPTSKIDEEGLGYGVDLVGQSSIVWWVASFPYASTAAKMCFNGATAT